MDTREAYNQWAAQYDSNENKTRDMEALALRSTLSALTIGRCLEVGCGTGKNTEWLVTRASEITAVDLSEEMLSKARQKIQSGKVKFQQADITKKWDFVSGTYDLVSFSLVLEHIQFLDPVFREASRLLNPGGHIYIGELHPFKQYSGSKARFETPSGVQVVPCFDHHISEFVQTGKRHGLSLVDINEFFDADDTKTIPRIFVLLLRKEGI